MHGSDRILLEYVGGDDETMHLGAPLASLKAL